MKKISYSLVAYYVNQNFKTPVAEIASWKYCRESSKTLINNMLNRAVQLNKQLYSEIPHTFLDHVKQFRKMQL